VFYPLTVIDFLDRAETVYPDRIGIVDEPDQPAPTLGEVTYRQMAANARAQAAKLDALGVPVGGRSRWCRRTRRDWSRRSSESAAGAGFWCR
jgi:fatty-acyl-CoA synthase